MYLQSFADAINNANMDSTHGTNVKNICKKMSLLIFFIYFS